MPTPTPGPEATTGDEMSKQKLTVAQKRYVLLMVNGWRLWEHYWITLRKAGHSNVALKQNSLRIMVAKGVIQKVPRGEKPFEYVLTESGKEYAAQLEVPQS